MINEPNQYHCLIAGLPELSLDNQKEWISISSFKEMLKEELSDEDFELVKLVFLKHDNDNLVEFLETGEIDDEKPGNFSLNDFREQAKLSSEITEENILPSYMVEVMEQFGDKEQKFDRLSCSRILAEKYFEYVQEKGSNFLKDYSRFEYELSNLLTFVEARKYEMEAGRFITGSTGIADHLRKNSTGVLAKDPEYDLFDEVISINGISSITEKEFRFDQLRQKVIEEMIFFEDFSIDWILGYLYMMFLVNRWAGLKQERGEEKLRNIVDGIKERNIENILSKEFGS